MIRGSYQRTPPRTSSYVLRALFDDMKARGVHFVDVAYTLGFSTTALSYWKSGRSSPSITDVEAFAKTLGYRLELIPLDERDKQE
jgi:transcriptional regulator with XRE-family HTH domain